MNPRFDHDAVFEAIVITLLLWIAVMVFLGFDLILQRLRPRVLYVYANPEKSQKPPADLGPVFDRPVKHPEQTRTSPVSAVKNPIPAR